MSLRKEIQNIIYMNIGKEKRIGITWLESETATKEILKLFETKIDKMIQVAEQEKITREPYPFGRVAALKEVKDLLK